MGSSRTPEELLYQFPRLPKVRLAKYARKFYTGKALAVIESLADQLGYTVRSGQGLHWRQKQAAAGHFRWGNQWYYLYQKEVKEVGQETGTTPDPH